MSESKGAMIAKTVQKHAGRAKEKFLQNLGKVDRTLDDIFEEHLQNFNRQHQQATRLQKEFNNYIRCIRAVQTASKSLMEAITEVYESGWSGHDLLYVQAQNLEMLWQDFSHKLGDQVLIPMNTYTNQFPEVRKKIEKRGRKLVDYDSQRHSFQNLQSNAAKRRDDVKVTRGREQLEEAKRTYEVLNSELHDELPALFDSRVLFYVNNLQTLFSSEQLFHSESNKVYAELEAITDKLATDSQRTSYKKPAVAASGGTLPSPAHNNVAAHTNGNSNTVQTPPSSPVPAPDTPNTPVTPTTPVTPSTPVTPTPTEAKLNGTTTPPSTPESDSPKDLAIKTDDVKDKSDKSDKLDKSEVSEAPTAPARHDDKQENGKNNNEEKDEKKVQDLYDIPAGSPVSVQESPNNNEEKRQVDVDTIEVERGRKTNDASKGDETYDIPVGATLGGLPAGTLYRVRATYRYQREDDDELSFDVGDIIRVVEYDDPEEQEEGWLMGMKESTNEKGMFPANFTRPI